MAEEEHDGASVGEILIEACRRNNTDLLTETLEGRSEQETSKLLNETTTVLGNHLYHEAASRGHYEIIDLLLDQPNFECDPITRSDRDTPLHTAIRWLNSEPPEQRDFGLALITMMLEAGSSPRVRNRAGLKPLQLVDPTNTQLRETLDKFEYAEMDNAGDFVSAGPTSKQQQQQQGSAVGVNGLGGPSGADGSDDDDDAEFSGSDEEERAEWERRRKARGRKG